MATLDALGRRTDAQRRRRGRTHASVATTTPTARTTTSAGRRGSCRRADRDFLEFSRRVIRIWKDHPVLRRRKFFQGRRIRGAEVFDITWLDPSGREMTDDDLELARRPLSRRPAEWRRHRRSGRAWRTNHRRLADCCCSTPARLPFPSSCRSRTRKSGGRRSSTPPILGNRHGDLRRRTAISCAHARWRC